MSEEPIKSGEATRQAQAAAAGMCRVHRTTPAEPGKTYCAACLLERAARARRNYNARRPAFGEKSRIYRCSLCGETGHSKSTCTSNRKP